jgi:mycofactocin precursor
VPKIISAEGARMSENETTAGTKEILTEELLVEEVSIDGMCGVY